VTAAAAPSASSAGSASSTSSAGSGRGNQLSGVRCWASCVPATNLSSCPQWTHGNSNGSSAMSMASTCVLPGVEQEHQLAAVAGAGGGGGGGCWWLDVDAPAANASVLHGSCGDDTAGGGGGSCELDELGRRCTATGTGGGGGGGATCAFQPPGYAMSAAINSYADDCSRAFPEAGAAGGTQPQGAAAAAAAAASSSSSSSAQALTTAVACRWMRCDALAHALGHGRCDADSAVVSPPARPPALCVLLPLLRGQPAVACRAVSSRLGCSSSGRTRSVSYYEWIVSIIRSAVCGRLMSQLCGCRCHRAAPSARSTSQGCAAAAAAAAAAGQGRRCRHRHQACCCRRHARRQPRVHGQAAALSVVR
jgi:hypothetical protein